MTIDKHIQIHQKWQCFEVVALIEAVYVGLEHLGELPESAGLERPLSLLKRTAGEAREAARTLFEQLSHDGNLTADNDG